MKSSKPAEAIASLCPQCGLCCNGVIFGDVELQRGDSKKVLAAAGIEFFRKGRKTAFSQPCVCLQRGLCTIYNQRPQRCATFDCGLLKRVQGRKITINAALQKISATKKRAEAVTKLVRELGNHDENKSLDQRYAAVIAEPIDMAADEKDHARRGQLLTAVSRLVEALERDFLQ